MNYVINRLKEPSTRIAIAGLLAYIAPSFPEYTAIINGIAGLIAGHTALTPDPK